MIYSLLKFILPSIFGSLWDLKTVGHANIPSEGGFIVASNHASHLDFFFFPCVVPQRVYYLAKKELFENPFWRMLLTSTNQIPVDRGKSDGIAFKAAQAVLERGDILGIFPEGTRSHDGKLLKGHTGVARLALISKKSVLPVGMRGTYEILPKGSFFPRLSRKAEIHIGEPMHFDKYYGLESDREALRKMTDDIMRKIARLAGKEYRF